MIFWFWYEDLEDNPFFGITKFLFENKDKYKIVYIGINLFSERSKFLLTFYLFDTSINFFNIIFMKIKIRNYLSATFFTLTLIFSYYLGIAYYDITTGLDFNKYINNIYFFSNESSSIFDSQGTIYFWTIAKFVDFLKKCIKMQI